MLNKKSLGFMELALEEAKKAALKNEVPVGAVVVKKGKVLSAAHNTREQLSAPQGHAEMEAIAKAAEKNGDWRLDGCDIYVTLEPCPMCAGAILNSRISRVFFGAYDSLAGSFGSVADFSAMGYPSSPEVHGGIMEQECAEILSCFFKEKR